VDQAMFTARSPIGDWPCAKDVNGACNGEIAAQNIAVSKGDGNGIFISQGFYLLKIAFVVSIKIYDNIMFRFFD
jgi:hypothetical protein